VHQRPHNKHPTEAQSNGNPTGGSGRLHSSPQTFVPRDGERTRFFGVGRSRGEGHTNEVLTQVPELSGVVVVEKIWKEAVDPGFPPRTPSPQSAR
jgi:hypothetical protein